MKFSTTGKEQLGLRFDVQRLNQVKTICLQQGKTLTSVIDGLFLEIIAKSETNKILTLDEKLKNYDLTATFTEQKQILAECVDSQHHRQITALFQTAWDAHEANWELAQEKDWNKPLEKEITN